MAIQLTFPEGAALVAGGTGTVGEGIVRRFSAADVPTYFTYFSQAEHAKALEAELRGAGGDVHAVRMDLGDAASIDAVLADAARRYGRLHSVACAAGARVPFNRMADFTAEEIARYFAGDALTYFRLFQRALPVLRAGGGGSLTACTTIALRRHIKFDGISPFSKGAVEALVRQLAAEEAEHGIRVNAVPIGWVTEAAPAELIAALRQDPSPRSKMLVELMEQLTGLVRLGRPARLSEAGDLFVYLASNQASYITGQSIALDGGATL